MKMRSTFTSIFVQIKVIFIWMVRTKIRSKNEAKGNSEMAY